MTLIERVESADGPDRELDAAILAAVPPDQVPSPIVESGYGWRYDRGYWWLATGEDSRTPPKNVCPPRYTTSIDVALTLFPDQTGPWSAWNCAIPRVRGAPTPALALCAAALKARGL